MEKHIFSSFFLPLTGLARLPCKGALTALALSGRPLTWKLVCFPGAVATDFEDVSLAYDDPVALQ